MGNLINPEARKRMTIGRLLNINQVADFLQVTPRSVYRMVESGDLPQGHLIKGVRRWFFEDIEHAIRFGIPKKTETLADIK